MDDDVWAALLPRALAATNALAAALSLALPLAYPQPHSTHCHTTCDHLHLAANLAAIAAAYLASETLAAAATSGAFEYHQRIAEAARSLGGAYLIRAAIASALGLYLLLALRLPDLSPSALFSLVNGYGMLLLAAFLGQGLVQLPRILWAQAKPAHRLRALAYGLAIADAEHRTAARVLAAAVRSAQAAVSAAREAETSEAAAALHGDERQRTRDAFAALSALVEGIAARTALPPDGGRNLSVAFRAAIETLGIASAFDMALAEREHGRLRRARAAERAAAVQRRGLVERASPLRAALTATEPGFGGTPVPSRRGLWLGALRTPSARLASAVCAAASLALLLSEACQLCAAVVPSARAASPSNLLGEMAPAAGRLIVCAYIAAAAWHALASSRILAPTPLSPPSKPHEWDGASGIAYVRHTSWLLRLALPLGTHAALLAASPRVGGDATDGTYQTTCSAVTLCFALATARGGLPCIPLRLLDVMPAEVNRYEKAGSKPRLVETGLHQLDAALRPTGPSCQAPKEPEPELPERPPADSPAAAHWACLLQTERGGTHPGIVT